MNLQNLIAITTFCLMLAGSVTYAQEKSVKPGINDSFKDPNVDEWVGKFEIESRETFEKRNDIVKAIDIQPGMTVADVGAGTGLFTRLFGTAVGPNGKVIAQDISQKFLDHIMKSAADNNLNRIRTVLGSDQSSKLEPNSVDLVFICDVYHHFEYPEKMMKSIHEALKLNGRLVIVDFKRIEGQSSEWTLKHVRAGQETVESEIQNCGFKKVDEKKDLLKDNYFIVFEKQMQ